MKDVYELVKMVDDYMERHGMKLLWNSINNDKLTYDVKTQDYDILNAKIITMKNGKTRVQFKINGDVTSIKK